MLLFEVQVAEFYVQNIFVFLFYAAALAHCGCSAALGHGEVIGFGVESDVTLLFGVEIGECNARNGVFAHKLRYKCVFKRHTARYGRPVGVGIDIRLRVIYFKLRREIDYRRFDVFYVTATADIELISSRFVGLELLRIDCRSNAVATYGAVECSRAWTWQRCDVDGG